MNGLTARIARTSDKVADERYSVAKIIFLHLIPGIIFTVTFILIAYLTGPLGWPANLALLLTWPLAGLPLLLGLLFYEGHKLNGRWSLKGVILYRQPLPLRQYGWLVPTLLVWTAIWSTLAFSLGEAFRQTLFPWWPGWLNLSGFAQNPTRYSNSILWAIVVLSAILNLAVPAVEELYFRGFLLPRMPSSAFWAPLLNASLFSLYHFWLPWDFFGRLIALLPVAYVVQWKRNAYISILVHCSLNSLGTIGLIALIFGPSR